MPRFVRNKNTGKVHRVYGHRDASLECDNLDAAREAGNLVPLTLEEAADLIALNPDAECDHCREGEHDG